MNKEHLCPVCSGPTVFRGSKTGYMDGRKFLIRHCELCHFSYVENYRTDLENIYNENYYHGAGADPTVDYVYELENFSKTIRNYEWQGIYSIYKDLCPTNGRWLDYGSGSGGLVKFAIENGVDAMGFERGSIAGLEDLAGKFDFISAIEVLEHIPKPVEVLMQIRKLLKPAGVLFVTTGNAQPWRNNLLAWDYTKYLDAHVSFYEPETLARCMRMSGFTPREFSSFKGFDDIIKFKVLKTLKIKDRSRLIDLLPWGVMTKFVDLRYKISRQPYGVANG